MKMDKARKQRHVMLYECLDELVADFTLHTKKRPSKTTVLELMEWSFVQTQYQLNEAQQSDTCEANKQDGEHVGWEFPNKDVLCLDCGQML